MNRRLLVALFGVVFIGLSGRLYAQHEAGKDSLYRETLSEALRNISQGSYPSALFNLKKCVEMSPADPVPYYQLADVYNRLADGTQAVYYAKKAFTLAPDNIWYEEFLISAAMKYQKPDALQMVLERRFARDDGYLEELLGAYAYTKSWDKALSAIAVYEKKHGRSEKAVGYRKDIFMKSEDYKNALAQLKVLRKMSPGNSLYAVQQAMIMESSGQRTSGLQILEDFHKKYPGDGFVAYALVPYYYLAEDYDKVFAALPQVVADTTIDAQERLKRLDMTAELAFKEEKFRPGFEKALETLLGASDSPVISAYASEYYYSRKEEKRGLELLRRAVYDGLKDQSAVLRLLYSDALSGDAQTLLKDTKRVLDSIGENAEVYRLYGYAAHSLGDPQTALTALEKAKRMAKDGAVQLYVEICSALGSLYDELGELDKSVENMELALMIDPDNATVLNNYGYMLARRGIDLPRVRGMLEKALKADPDNPAFLDSYAWILYLQKDYRGALTAIDRSLEKDTDPSSEVLEHYHKILQALGDKPAEAAALKRLEEKKKAEQAAKPKTQSAD